MVTFIHAADFHLDSPFRELTGEQAALRRKEQRNLLRRLADLARERKVDFVLLAGDLFDGANLYRETGEALVSALGQMDCPVFIAPGNHDPVTSGSPYRTLVWPENVHIFTEEAVQAVELEGCVIHGTAFTAADREDDPLEGFCASEDGRVHIMVAHGDVGGRRYAPISTDSIARSGLHYLALGHIHAASGLQKTGETYWAYPGCPEGRGFDECGEKGVLVCKLEKEIMDAEFVPLCARRYERLETEVRGDAEHAARVTLLGHEHDICRLTFVGETDVSPDLAVLERELAGSCFALSLRDRTTVARDLWARAGEDNLTGLFLQEMRARLDEAESEEDQALLELAVRFGLAALDRGEDCRP